jgi:rhomboid family GlyGly-CTERM serine protease
MRTADPTLRWHILALALLMLGLGLFHESVNPWLEYQRDAIAAGQWWRLVSGHFVHMNLWHLGMNLAGFLLCWFFFVDLLTRRVLWGWLAVSIPLVSAGFWFLDTDLHGYVGLSGILHGLLIMCLLAGFSGHPRLHGFLLLVIVGRLVMEQLPGYDVDYLQDTIGGAVYVNAHLYGALAGALLGGLWWWHRRSAVSGASTGAPPDQQ